MHYFNEEERRARAIQLRDRLVPMIKANGVWRLERTRTGPRDLWSWQTHGLSLLLMVSNQFCSVTVYYGGNRDLLVLWYPDGHATVHKYAPGRWEQRVHELSLQQAVPKRPVAEMEDEATR